MCSRYCLTLPPEAVRSYFKLREIDSFPPRFNIAPTQPVGIVRNSPRHEPEFVLVRWGLVPSWVKAPLERATLVNARAETAAEKPSFRGALRHRRCIVPATGFYEWRGKARARTPYLIRPRAGAAGAGRALGALGRRRWQRTGDHGYPDGPGEWHDCANSRPDAGDPAP